jgi:hypothetical protein
VHDDVDVELSELRSQLAHRVVAYPRPDLGGHRDDLRPPVVGSGRKDRPGLPLAWEEEPEPLIRTVPGKRPQLVGSDRDPLQVGRELLGLHNLGVDAAVEMRGARGCRRERGRHRGDSEIER